MTEIRFFAFGSPYIENAGSVASVDTRKALALLAYVVMNPSRQSRDSLGVLLWPESDDSSARAALRRTLSSLNKAIDSTVIQADRDSIEFVDGAGFWCDVTEFEDLLDAVDEHDHKGGLLCADCLSGLNAAADLSHDDFMAGFSLRDSPTFDDWQYNQGERLRRRLARALEKLVAYYTAKHSLEAAITTAHRWLNLDPLHESVHRILMKLYAWDGQRSAALQQYRDCVRVLEQELGVSPLEETVQLYKAIQEDRLDRPENQAARVSPNAGRVTVTALDLPLVGRDAEVSSLLHAVEKGHNGPSVIVIEGEQGIGKTRLAEESRNHWDAYSLSIRCYEGESQLAYGAIINLLRALLKKQTGWLEKIPAQTIAEVSRLIPELLSMRPDVEPAAQSEGEIARTRLFEAISTLIHSAVEDHGAVLMIVDDVHWADSASLDVLSYVIRRFEEMPVMLVMCWRTDMQPLDTPLYRAVITAQREGLCDILTLKRLHSEDVAALVTSIEPSFAELGDRLFDESEGLPLFIAEYLNAIRSQPEPSDVNWELPHNIQELIQNRLYAVDDVGYQILSSGAVIGTAFDFDSLTQISGRSEDELLVGLDNLIRLGLVHEIPPVSGGASREVGYDFYHAKLGTVLYGELTSARRQILHRRAGNHLISRVRREGNFSQYGQIAYHSEMARDDEQASQYYQLAGQHAASVYANREALRFYRQALALGSGSKPQLHAAIGNLNMLQGQYQQALISFEAAAAFSEGEQLGRVEHRIGLVHYRLGDWELAEHYFDAAMQLLEDDKAELARINADWCLTAHRQGNIKKATSLAEQALAFAEQSGDKRAEAQAYNILGILARNEGLNDVALDHLGKSLQIAEGLSDIGAQVAALNNLALVQGDMEQYGPAIDLTQQALALCRLHGDRHLEAALHSNLADLFHYSGQIEQSREHLRTSVEILAEIGSEDTTIHPEIWKIVEW